MKKRTVSIALISTISILLILTTQQSAITFLKEAIKNPDKVGTLSPCSQYVAIEIASSIRTQTNKPLSILEIGAGTGALTQAIIKKLQSGDCFDIVELLPEYYAILRQKFGNHHNVTIKRCSILDWLPEYTYDCIICSLPFNTFKPELIQAMLAHFKKLIKPGGMFSYVELMWLPHIKKFFLPQPQRERFEKTLALMAKFRKDYGTKTVPIYWNITPIYVHHLKI